VNHALKTTDPYSARLLATVQHDAFMLRKIAKQAWSEELLLAAVSSQGRAIQLIASPSRAVALAAVQQDGDALQFITEQTEELCAAACRQWLGALHHIADEATRHRVVAVLMGEGLLASDPFEADAANAPAYRG
jgi:hypothetical protein